MVAQCAGCNLYEPWAGLLIGFMAGCVYYGISKLMVKCGLDDPLDAVAGKSLLELWGTTFLLD